MYTVKISENDLPPVDRPHESLEAGIKAFTEAAAHYAEKAAEFPPAQYRVALVRDSDQWIHRSILIRCNAG